MEFNLSEKILKNVESFSPNGLGRKLHNVYPEENVKEFIRLLKDVEIDLRKIGISYEDGVLIWDLYNKEIDKLSGEKLV